MARCKKIKNEVWVDFRKHGKICRKSDAVLNHVLCITLVRINQNNKHSASKIFLNKFLTYSNVSISVGAVLEV